MVIQYTVCWTRVWVRGGKENEEVERMSDLRRVCKSMRRIEQNELD